MRFYLDEDVHPAVAEAGRKLGLDVVSAHELDRRGYGDREQLQYAASEERILVTRNRDDFIRLTVACYQSGDGHRGVIIIPYSLPNRDPGRVARALKKWTDTTGDLEIRYAIFFLEG